MAYTDSTQVSNFLQRSLTQYESDALAGIIAAIKIWLDKKLNSTFDEVSETTRYYDGGRRNLDIDPCTAITEVATLNDDGTESYSYTTIDDYVTEPQNETVKREIRKRFAPFPRGVHRVAVTAKFSEYDSAVPSDIQLVATHLAAAVINAGKQANTYNVASESLEGHSISYVTGNNSSDGSTLDSLANSDPAVASIIASRMELYVDNYEPTDHWDFDEDDGGLLL